MDFIDLLSLNAEVVDDYHAYIYGYIPSYGDKVETIYRNKNYTDIHDYQNDGLYYDEDAKIEKKKMKIINIRKK